MKKAMSGAIITRTHLLAWLKQSEMLTSFQ